jgi:hypothetical protein
MDASGDADYQAIRAQVVAGTMDIDDAIRLTIEHCKAMSRSSAAELNFAKQILRFAKDDKQRICEVRQVRSCT